jgi:hypothetical protein
LSHGGGHVTLLGRNVKSGFQGSTVFQHQSTLRLVLWTLSIRSFSGASGTAPDMGEFFK